MKLQILKGADEIGGNCIKLQTNGTTVIIDYGTPLQETSKQVKLPKEVDAILISHPHQDHFGEIKNIDDDIPIFCGKATKDMIKTTAIFTGEELPTNNFQTFEAWQSFKIGDIKITPYLVDHSAVDAYAFLVEADDKKVLYGGDFRANGRKSKLFHQMIKDNNLKDVDILLLEGTMIKRSNEEFVDEKSVEEKIYKTIKENSQISFLISSSQNIDRIVSAYRASKKAGKVFVIDIYTAWILEVIKENISKNIPNISWNDVKVIKNFGGSYYEKLKEHKEYFSDFTSRVFKNIVEIKDIKSNPQNYLLKVSPSHIKKVLKLIDENEANIIYAQWLGYMKKEYSDDRTVELYKDLKSSYDWVYAHTSGHADIKTLQKFTEELKPKKVVPIHTEYKEKFEKYFDKVMVLEDGESFDLKKDNLSSYQVKKLNELFKCELQQSNKF